MMNDAKPRKRNLKMARKKKVSVGRKVGQQAVGVETLIQTVIKHHKAGGSQSSVARELGVTPAAISLRLKYLRDQGVKGLPEFARGAGNSGKTVVERAREALAALGVKG
jgi:hypothetical protein